MEIRRSAEKCPKCGSMRLEKWVDLSEEQQRLATALPGSVHHPPEKRKKHRFCTRCWFEDTRMDDKA